MFKLNHVLLLFIVIVLEGYVVLSTELLAIRQTIPFVGSGTDTMSIIIAAVLMPLAFGYYFGGRWRPTKPKKSKRKRSTLRKKLIFNIIAASVILLIGSSYALINTFFIKQIEFGVTDRLILTTLYALLFLVTPVYLLGQTIPLVSNYFNQEKLSKITGRMLFFSTIGSFLGAVFSSVVLMATIGVHYTVCVNFVLLTILVFLLSKKKISEAVLISLALTISAFALNSDYVMKKFHIVENNQYNTIAVYENARGTVRQMSLNNNASSKYTDYGRKHEYVEFVERIVIDPIRGTDEPKDILVIGAGAFTFGHEDAVNNYDYVDIDKTLRRVAEEYILKEKLKNNKSFHAMPVRAWLTRTGKKYDFIFLDAFLGDLTIPEHLVTQEFFGQIRKHLKEGGIVVANFSASPNMASRFSRHIDNTFRSVFPHVSRHVTLENYSPWNREEHKIGNVIYIYSDHKEADPDEIYTDDKNRVFYDKPRRK